MNVHIIEVPLDYGGRRHGSDMGPSAVRLAGLKNKIESIGHDVITDEKGINIIPQENAKEGSNPKAKYLEPIVKVCTELAQNVKSSVEKNEFPLVIGGDHSIVLGTLAGLNSSYKKNKKKLGVLYVDAHGDFNTDETTPTGNIHGECLAASAGFGLSELVNLFEEGRKVDPANICYVGIRDLDKGERELMKKAGVTVFTISDIDRMGFAEVVKKVKLFFKTKCDTVHISFDMDSLDPSVAPGTGVPVPGGLNYREALLLMEEMNSLGLVNSMDIVEVNPILDVRNQTAIMAVNLAARILGEKLY
ncbi:MAG: arginase [Treponema sp.]|nr:arginase [Treponema sp.]